MSYSYDELNRLKSYSDNHKISLKYDDFGNIIWKSDIGTYSYNNVNAKQRVTSITKRVNGDDVITNKFKYDDFGNIVKEVRNTKDTISIKYNSFNKPLKISNNEIVQSFRYGSSNQEIISELKKPKKETIKRIKPFNDYEVIIEGNKKTIVHYIILNGTLVASRNIVVENDSKKDFNLYFHKDNLGSITNVTDEQGNVIKKYSYDPFGKRKSTLLKSTSEEETYVKLIKGFTGHEHHDSFGYINAKGRFYNPVIGRFLSADPFIKSPNNLQSLNRYSYVLNNPLNLIDPSGFFFQINK